MSGCIVPPHNLHWSTFSFSESRTAFSFAVQKKKWFWPPPGRQKNNCKIKTSHFSHKRKSGFHHKGHASSVRRQSRATSAHSFRKPPTQAAWISTDKERYSTHSTAVAQKGPRVAQTQAAEDRRITQRILPKGYPSRVGALSGCIVPPHNLHWSTFSFSESRTAFSFAVQKKKWFWPQPGRQKTNCKVNTSRSPAKEKVVLPAGGTSHP